MPAPHSTVPDIITYRYNGTMVYVTPAATYEEGVQFARQVFPELAAVDPERISISVNGLVHQHRQLIRIGPMAWKTVVHTRARFEVLDVTLEPAPGPTPDGPEIVVTNPDGLPDYDAVKKMYPEEEEFIVPSRAPSPPRNVHKPMPSACASRPRTGSSRSSSPSPSSRSSDSCSTLDWAKSLFGKRVRQ